MTTIETWALVYVRMEKLSNHARNTSRAFQKDKSRHRNNKGLHACKKAVRAKDAEWNLLQRVPSAHFKALDAVVAQSGVVTLEVR